MIELRGPESLLYRDISPDTLQVLLTHGDSVVKLGEGVLHRLMYFLMLVIYHIEFSRICCKIIYSMLIHITLQIFTCQPFLQMPILWPQLKTRRSSFTEFSFTPR